MRNLLADDGDEPTVALYQNNFRAFVPMTSGKNRKLEDLQLVQVNSLEEAVSCMRLGVDRRATLAKKTPGYAQQSVSVFTVHVTTLEQEEDGTQTIMKSKLNLVELLGAESLKKAGREGSKSVAGPPPKTQSLMEDGVESAGGRLGKNLHLKSMQALTRVIVSLRQGA